MNFKMIFVLVLVLSVAVAGCVANSQDNQEIEDNVQAQTSSETTGNDDGNGIQDVRIINSEPIKYDNVRSYEVYWDWHNCTSDLLRENLGEEIKIYCHYLSYSGELKEVGKYYILLDDHALGLIYVDIDQITAISKEKPVSYSNFSRSGSSSVRCP